MLTAPADYKFLNDVIIEINAVHSVILTLI